jgi:hypothetical protein
MPGAKNGKPCNIKDLQGTQKGAYKPAYKKYQETTETQLQNVPVELAEIVTIWPELPLHIKAAIKALVQTHTKEDDCHKKLPKEQELLQLPGRGGLDFVPIISALKQINYRGWIEVFKSAWKKEGLVWFRSYAKPLGRIKDIEQLWRGRLYVELQTFEAISKALKKVEDKLDKLGSADSRIRRLQTIPGVGPRLAETVVAFLDDPKRFRNGKHVGSYAGLTPKQYQSGQMERQGAISGQGNKLLRNLFIEICWTSVRHNPWARDTYNRLLRGSPSRKKIAITTLARKLLVKCWATLRDEKDWKYNVREDAA